MALKERVHEDMKAAMRAGERDRLGTIRLLLAAIKQREVDERISLDDAQVLSVVEKLIKQRRESIGQFQAGGREDLVAKENAELILLQTYLPEPLNEQALEQLITAAITQVSAQSIKDMGKVMAIVKTQAAGRVDMAAAGARIKARLSQ